MRQTNVPAGRVELSVHHGRPRPRAQPGFGGQKAADALEDGHDHHHVGGLRGREQAPSRRAARPGISYVTLLVLRRAFTYALIRYDPDGM